MPRTSLTTIEHLEKHSGKRNTAINQSQKISNHINKKQKYNSRPKTGSTSTATPNNGGTRADTRKTMEFQNYQLHCRQVQHSMKVSDMAKNQSHSIFNLNHRQIDHLAMMATQQQRLAYGFNNK